MVHNNKKTMLRYEWYGIIGTIYDVVVQEENAQFIHQQ